MEKLKTKDNSYFYKGELYSRRPYSVSGEVVRIVTDNECNFCRRLKYEEYDVIDKGERIIDSIPVLNLFRDRYERSYNHLEKLPVNIQFMTPDKANKLFHPTGIRSWFFKKIDTGSKAEIFAGDILFRHPFFPNTYVEDISEVKLFQDRISCISALAGKLGASKVEGHAIWKGSSKRTMNISGGIDYQVYSLEGNYKEKQKEKYQKEFSLTDEFSGGTPDLKEAERYATEVGLINNSDIKNLIEVRKGNNPIKSRHIKISLSEEIEKMKAIAFKLNVVPTLALKGKYKETCETCNEVDFEFTIIF